MKKNCPYIPQLLARFTALILGLLAVGSTALNILLWQRSTTAERSLRATASLVGERGSAMGKEMAEKDFALGQPRWYQTGDFAVPIPNRIPGQKHVTFGCLVSEFEPAFVKAYNTRMEELLGSNDRPQKVR